MIVKKNFFLTGTMTFIIYRYSHFFVVLVYQHFYADVLCGLLPARFAHVMEGVYNIKVLCEVAYLKLRSEIR